MMTQDVTTRKDLSTVLAIKDMKVMAWTVQVTTLYMFSKTVKDPRSLRFNAYQALYDWEWVDGRKIMFENI